MEVRIGIQHSPREISFETDQAAADLRATIEKALTDASPLVVLTDSKGKQFLVPTASIAYVELGSESGRKVGFVS